MERLRMISPKQKIILVVSILALLIAVLVVTTYVLRQPSQADYQSAKKNQIINVTTARNALAPAVNKYLAAFKVAYNESRSPDDASKAAKPEYDAFKQAEKKATDAMKALSDSPVTHVAEISTAVDQLKSDYDSEVAYYAGLVEAYPEYTVLFAAEQQQCSGILVGQTSSLVDRKQKLDAAAEPCLAALADLKKVSNVTYVDYAKKIERRVKQIQEDATVTAKAESDVTVYEAQVVDYQKKADEAMARNASKEELNKLAAEIKATTAKINENKAGFEFAGKRYISNVKQIPTLFNDVYARNLPAELERFAQLIEVRTDVVSLLVDSKIEIQ